MKIVTILGSPRPGGNSTTLANHFTRTAADLGAEVTTFALNTLRYSGCQACYLCKTREEKCVLEDDLGPVLHAVAESDVLVLATPVYFGNVSGQMKTFFDRTFSFLVPDYPTNPVKSRLGPGRKAVFIISQGNPDEDRFADIFPNYEFFLKWYGFEEVSLIRAVGVRNIGDIEGRRDLFELTADTAGRIVTGQP